ncbi:transglycosylase SLT domain-containing protein [Desulfobulbus sp.]|uniref:transglycosylase SLT domain-containing protein n=1 Tax=Desulfobulbus sp. TaxID=895 RepID=UPI0027B92701|nr:transglycosylase SLT domain-containing protein [Desulfobulbus sp.]
MKKPVEQQSPTVAPAPPPEKAPPTAKSAEKSATKSAAKPTVQRKPRSPAKKGAGRKRRSKKPQISTRRQMVFTSLEICCLSLSAMTAIVVLLGHAAGRFSGARFFPHLLPFTLGVSGLIVAAALLLLGWLRARRWLGQKAPFLPAALALVLALVIGGFALKGNFYFAFSQFRILVGGKEEAARVTLTHQVFAAYRRQDAAQLQQLIDRAKPYDQDIDAAAAAFDLDPDLLHGVAAAESSFLPRDSKDGGQGLFQITQIPEPAMRQAGERLGVDRPVIVNHRHNGFVAAATLKHYLKQMNNDLFLGLLAYNIGPKNGGLRFIMQQYGATDFITIQPYLQQLPRDYPIRVLSQALAFRLHRLEGKLPAYEEGLNAVRIQHIGVPGL